MDLTGQVLGKYHILEELGSGGMAVVYKAYDPTLDRNVAVKVLLPQLVRDKEFVRRFLREAQSAAKLEHPNVITVYEVGEVGGVYYLAMAYLPGRSLAEIIAERGPLPLGEALAITEQVAAALDYAHKEGLVHRDVKPANILLDKHGLAVLTDFGIVRAAEGTRLTATGTTLGTPAYMSPEQARGEVASAASDLYSLGVVLYELLVGDIPFHAPTPASVLLKHMVEAPPPLRQRNPAVLEEVERVVLWVLSKEPSARPASGAALVTALRQAAASGSARLAGARTPLREVPAAMRPTEVAGRPPAPVQPQGERRSARPKAADPRASPRPARPPTPAQRAVAAPPVRRTRFPPWAWVVVVVAAVGLTLLVARLATEDHSPPPVATAPTGVGDETLVPAQDTATAKPPPTTTPFVAPTAAPSPLPASGDTWIRSADGMVMVYVPAGEFSMGSTTAQIDAVFEQCVQALGSSACDRSSYEDEYPQHRVSLDAFWIDRTEVTNAQYRDCVEARVCSAPLCWDDPDLNAPEQPVVCVGREDAQTYCAWVGGRLPTEAEWEYAARGPEGQIYPWGNTFDGSRLNYCDANCPPEWEGSSSNDGYAYTAPVGSYSRGASWCGALDMAGNVWEWVSDWYDAGYYARSPSWNPLGPGSGEERLIRGGAWNGDQWVVRTCYRGKVSPSYQADRTGFRCLASTPE